MDEKGRGKKMAKLSGRQVGSSRQVSRETVRVVVRSAQEESSGR